MILKISSAIFLSSSLNFPAANCSLTFAAATARFSAVGSYNNLATSELFKLFAINYGAFK
jgi:hypothetical protein